MKQNALSNTASLVLLGIFDLAVSAVMSIIYTVAIAIVVTTVIAVFKHDGLTRAFISVFVVLTLAYFVHRIRNRLKIMREGEKVLAEKLKKMAEEPVDRR